MCNWNKSFKSFRLNNKLVLILLYILVLWSIELSQGVLKLWVWSFSLYWLRNFKPHLDKFILEVHPNSFNPMVGLQQVINIRGYLSQGFFRGLNGRWLFYSGFSLGGSFPECFLDIDFLLGAFCWGAYVEGPVSCNRTGLKDPINGKRNDFIRMSSPFQYITCFAIDKTR